MPYAKYPLLGKNGVKMHAITERESLVHVGDFARACVPGADFSSFLDSLPNGLAAGDLKEFISRLAAARRLEKPIIWGMGAHVIKLGLGPLLVDLMQRGWISALAVNGAFMIHDFELALIGATSEDVASGLLKGSYGTTQETGLFLNRALREGHENGMGAGEAVGSFLMQSQLPHADQSVLFHAYKLNIPVTVHPAIGTDSIHFHPHFSGEVTGALAEHDFRLFASIVSKLSGGGVYLNIGSAVLLPEVFLKAVAFCAAQSIRMHGFTTAVFDFNRHYRPLENVVRRPTADGGRGFYFVGHHEIMIPLLAAIILNSRV
jgi:hypothetical protein